MMIQMLVGVISLAPLASSFSLPAHRCTRRFTWISASPDKDPASLQKILDLPGPDLKFVDPWVDDYVSQPKLLAGDVIGILVFAAVGRGSHAEDVGLLGTFLTAFPFLVGYFSVASPLGAYSEDATSSYSRAFTSLAPSWFAGTSAGILLRAIGKFSIPPMAFIIATSIFTFVFLATPRALQVFLETGEAPKLPVFKMPSTDMLDER